MIPARVRKEPEKQPKVFENPSKGHIHKNKEQSSILQAQLGKTELDFRPLTPIGIKS